MGKVIFNNSVSLDGFVAGPNDEVDEIFKWYWSGDVEVPFPGSEMVFKVSPASAALFDKTWPTIGASVLGRRMFDVSHAWGGKPPLGVHTFVVTHRPPQEWVKEESPFTFVTDGVVSAVQQAKQYAGAKDVVISSANIMQQALKAGLLDEIYMDLAPVLLGKGIRLFDRLTEPIELEPIHVIEGKGVTHLGFRVVR
ncbi:MAG TPA: dihydrofolate reductase family protein [Anaerolineae bacterium]|nr:dihydrofolate reductase family protein [Anaerolineae bacterium]